MRVKAKIKVTRIEISWVEIGNDGYIEVDEVIEPLEDLEVELIEKM
jgi:hypothetical protein